MKKIINLLSVMACLVTLVSCGSTNVPKHSLNWTSDKVTSVKKARTLAENWDLNVKADGNFPALEGCDVLFAEDQHKTVLFVQKTSENGLPEYGFCYVSIDGNNSTTIFVTSIMGNKIYLNNNAPQAKLNTNNADSRLAEIEKTTAYLVNLRTEMEKLYSKVFDIHFWEQNNEKQMALYKKYYSK